MGVDYSAHYGIGFKIKLVEFDDELTEEAQFEHTKSILEDSLDEIKYSFFEVGEGNYSGEDNDLYVEVNHPFGEGLNDLEKLKAELKAHLKQLGIEPDGEFGLIGGLEVW